MHGRSVGAGGRANVYREEGEKNGVVEGGNALVQRMLVGARGGGRGGRGGGVEGGGRERG